jgi:Tfp pilus assembly protein PilW
VLSDRRGFTVIELIVTMGIAMIVLSAAGRLIVVTQASNARIEGRVDASQRGRTAIEAMTQELRAMVCLPDQTAPVVSATPDSITWYADLDANTTFNQEQRRLTAVRDASGNLTSIVEERWIGVTPPTNTAANRKRTLITNIKDKRDPSNNNAIEPVFSYYAYPDGAATTPTTQLAGTVLAADLRKIVRVDIAFRALASTRNNIDSKQAADFEDSVYARTVRRDNGGNQPTFDCTG